jgi:hypothetical protein
MQLQEQESIFCEEWALRQHKVKFIFFLSACSTLFDISRGLGADANNPHRSSCSPGFFTDFWKETTNSEDFQ